MSDDDDMDCPLCMEELDIADRYFRPCPCGYQICRFCWHHIKTNLNGRCPACRRVYTDQIVEFIPVSAEEVLRQKREKKEKERQERDMKERRQLSNMRVVQKNLVYVLGLSAKYASAEDDLFKKYGKIVKLVVSKRTHTSSASSVGIYVTYARKDDAARAIEGINGAICDGKAVRASYGTTKYCSYFLRHMNCPNPNCMYLHEAGNDADSYSKENPTVGSKHASSTTGHMYPNKRPTTSASSTTAAAAKAAASATASASAAAATAKPTPTTSASETILQDAPPPLKSAWAPIPKVVRPPPQPVAPPAPPIEPEQPPAAAAATSSSSSSTKNKKKEEARVDDFVPVTPKKAAAAASAAASMSVPAAPSPSSSSSAANPITTSTIAGTTSKRASRQAPHVPAPPVDLLQAEKENEKPALPPSASWATSKSSNLSLRPSSSSVTPDNFGPSLSDALATPQKPKVDALPKKKDKKKTKMVSLEEFEKLNNPAPPQPSASVSTSSNKLQGKKEKAWNVSWSTPAPSKAPTKDDTTHSPLISTSTAAVPPPPSTEASSEMEHAPEMVEVHQDQVQDYVMDDTPEIKQKHDICDDDKDMVDAHGNQEREKLNENLNEDTTDWQQQHAAPDAALLDASLPMDDEDDHDHDNVSQPSADAYLSMKHALNETERTEETALEDENNDKDDHAMYTTEHDENAASPELKVTFLDENHSEQVLGSLMTDDYDTNSDIASVNDEIVRAFDAQDQPGVADKIEQEDLSFHLQKQQQQQQLQQQQQQHQQPRLSHDFSFGLPHQHQQQQQQQQPMPPGFPFLFPPRPPPPPPPGMMHHHPHHPHHHHQSPPPGFPPPPPGWLPRNFDLFQGQDPNVIAARRLQHSQQMLEASGLFGFGARPSPGPPPPPPVLQGPPPHHPHHPHHAHHPLHPHHHATPPPPPPPGPSAPAPGPQASATPPPPGSHPLMHPAGLPTHTIQQASSVVPPPGLFSSSSPSSSSSPPQQQQQQQSAQREEHPEMAHLRRDFHQMQLPAYSQPAPSPPSMMTGIPPVSQHRLSPLQQHPQHPQQQQQQQQQQFQLRNDLRSMLPNASISFASPPSSNLPAAVPSPSPSAAESSQQHQQASSPMAPPPGLEQVRQEAQNFFGEFLKKAASQHTRESHEGPNAKFQDPAIMSMRVHEKESPVSASQQQQLPVFPPSMHPPQARMMPPPSSAMSPPPGMQQQLQQKQQQQQQQQPLPPGLAFGSSQQPQQLRDAPPPLHQLLQQQHQHQQHQQQQQQHQQQSPLSRPPHMMMAPPGFNDRAPPPSGMLPNDSGMKHPHHQQQQPFMPPPPHILTGEPRHPSMPPPPAHHLAFFGRPMPPPPPQQQQQQQQQQQPPHHF